jgi:hypothetical protein
MARVTKKVKAAKKPQYINFRTGATISPEDAGLLIGLRQALALERGGAVTVSDTIREAIRFRAKKRGIELAD